MSDYNGECCVTIVLHSNGDCCATMVLCCYNGGCFVTMVSRNGVSVVLRL